MEEPESEYDLGIEVGFDGLSRLSYAHLKSTHQQVIVQEFLPDRFPSMDICVAYRQNALQCHSFFECNPDCASQNLLKIAEGGTESSIPFLIFESLHNLTTLKEWYENSDQAMKFDFLTIYSQILRPLFQLIEQSHTHGIIHRNLTPITILVQYLDDKTVQPYIWAWETAFTISKTDIQRISNLKEIAELPEGFDAIGTPGFLAPEVAMGRQPLFVSDIYNFGSILYYLVTNGSSRETMNSLEDFILDPIANGYKIDTELNAIIVKATQFEPKNRYHSVTELIEALENYTKSENAKLIDKLLNSDSDVEDSESMSFTIGLEIEIGLTEKVFIPLNLPQMTLEDSKSFRFDHTVHPKLTDELISLGIKGDIVQFFLGYSKNLNIFYIFEGYNSHRTLINNQLLEENKWIPIELEEEITIKNSRIKIRISVN